MEAPRTSETSVDIQLKTWQYIPDDFELHTRCCENLNSHKFLEASLSCSQASYLIQSTPYLKSFLILYPNLHASYYVSILYTARKNKQEDL
jgi:hypothetical protein